MTHSFDERAATWDDEAKTARAESVATTISETVDGSAPTANHPVRLLEYGAGTGLVAQFLAPLLGAATAVTLADSSTGMRQVAGDKIRTGVLPADTRLWALNLDTDPTPTDDFDLIITVLALHHVADLSRTLAGFAAMLAPAGQLVIVDLEEEDGSFHADMGDGGPGPAHPEETTEPGGSAQHEDPAHHGHSVIHGFGEPAMTSALAAAGLTCDYRPGIYHIDKDGRPYPLFMALGARH